MCSMSQINKTWNYDRGMCLLRIWQEEGERGGDSTWVLEGTGAFESQKSRSET